MISIPAYLPNGAIIAIQVSEADHRVIEKAGRGSLTPDQAAKVLGISRRQLNRYVTARIIKPARIGHRTVRFSWAAIEAAQVKLNGSGGV